MRDPQLLEYHLSETQKFLNLPGSLPNSYFRLVKPTEENLNIYKSLTETRRFSHIRLAFVAPILIFKEVLWSISIAVLYRAETHSWSLRSKSPCRKLFVSHFTHAQNPEMPDVFFGSLPTSADHIFYLNSTRIPRQRIESLFSGKKFRMKMTVTTKSLSIPETLKMQFMNLGIAFKMLSISVKARGIPNIQRQILVLASISQVSRSTCANQILLHRFQEVVRETKPSKVFITFEGHLYEHLLLTYLRENHPDIILCPYQHAPIVPAQYGLIRNLKQLSTKETIFCSGEATRSYIESLRPSISVVVLGSPKWRPSEFHVRRHDSITVIGAAEGTSGSLESMASLLANLSLIHKDFTFVIRPHPATEPKDSSRILSKYDSGSNLKFSLGKLDELLMISHYCIYRSSAVAIEGLRFGTVPLFFNPSGDQGLNPLSIANLGNPAFTNSEELSKFFSDVTPLGPPIKEELFNNLRIVGESYFSKLNPFILDRF